MPPHDYDLPPEWNAMTPEERDEWFHEERSRRQFLRQTRANNEASDSRWKYNPE